MKPKHIAICATLLVAGCSSNNLKDVKQHAEATWQQAGFRIVGYEGFQWGQWGILGSSYGGAMVYYTLRHVPDNGVTYEGALQRWGDEYHIYDLKAVDAIRPRNSP